jgi:hypothetical protein
MFDLETDLALASRLLFWCGVFLMVGFLLASKAGYELLAFVFVAFWGGCWLAWIGNEIARRELRR